jgi:hypothetical protein
MSRNLLFLVVLVVVAMLVGWYFFVRRTPNDTATLTVNDRVFEIEIAETIADRARGLSGREPLKNNEGMLFIFPVAGKYSFWMKDMLFPIDMVWIRDARIVGITADIPPPEPGTSMLRLDNYPPPQAVDMVFEIVAGEAQRAGMKVGDLVVLGDRKLQ